jgi:hypothetical protein
MRSALSRVLVFPLLHQLDLRPHPVSISESLLLFVSLPICVVVRSSEPTSSSTKAAVKAPAHTAAQAPGHWAAKREPATLWGSEIDGKHTTQLASGARPELPLHCVLYECYSGAICWRRIMFTINGSLMFCFFWLIWYFSAVLLY